MVKSVVCDNVHDRSDRSKVDILKSLQSKHANKSNAAILNDLLQAYGFKDHTSSKDSYHGLGQIFGSPRLCFAVGIIFVIIIGIITSRFSLSSSHS
jgi:hypothetical protein